MAHVQDTVGNGPIEVDEAETTRLSGLRVHQDVCRNDIAERSEICPEILFGRNRREPTDEHLGQAIAPASTAILSRWWRFLLLGNDRVRSPPEGNEERVRSELLLLQTLAALVLQRHLERDGVEVMQPLSPLLSRQQSATARR
jgi:hypothetical protein